MRRTSFVLDVLSSDNSYATDGDYKHRQKTANMEDDPVLDWSVEDDEQREQYTQTSAQAPAAAIEEENI